MARAPRACAYLIWAWFSLLRAKLMNFSNDFEILSARKFYKRFTWKIVKLSTIFREASPRGCFWNFFCRPPTLSKSESHMILQLQAKVHGLGNLGVLTYTYPIFSWFETPKSDPFLPSFLHDKPGRPWGVVVAVKAFSEPACLLTWLFSTLLCFALLAIDWLIDWLTDWLTDWLIDWLTDWLTECLTDWLTVLPV